MAITVADRAVIAALARLGARAGVALELAATAGGLEIAGEWKRTFRRSSDPSIAGRPPRRQTGTYSRSIHVETLERSTRRAVVGVGTSLTSPPYPLYLEYGTSRMPAHPIARPALARSRGAAQRAAVRTLRAGLGLP